MKRFGVVAGALLMCSSGLFADFSYEQTSKLTGGTIMSMMKVVGVFSKQAREPMKSSVAVKGDRMAHLMGQLGQIIDLSNETITEINFQRKTYSVVTFAQMVEAVKQAEAKMKSEQGAEQTDMEFKASVKQTGQTREISGFNTKEMVLTLEMTAKNAKTGERGGVMTVVADMWLAPRTAGYDEVQKFHQRMAQKLSWAPGGGMMMARPDISKGMAGLYQEAAKMDGVPVLQITKMSMAGMPTEAGAGASQEQAQPQQEAEEKPSIGGALGRLGGGRLGGFGGFGRKKKTEEPKPAAQPETKPAAAAPAADQSQPANSAVMMEMQTELSGFSPAPVDTSKFDVPAGFKQVESETLKMMRR